MQVVHATFPAGEGEDAVAFLNTLGVDLENYKLITSASGDLLIINLLYGDTNALLDNLTSKYDFASKGRSLVIFTPDAVLPKDEQKSKRAAFQASRESLINFAREKSVINLEYIVLVILSSIITSLGLILDNVAVIVGGMVIAPVLGPILGITTGIVLGDSSMIRKGAAAEVLAITIGVTMGAIFGLIMPDVELTTSLLIRMSPSLADLLIAMAAGGAGAYTLIKGQSEAGLVGVMIAASLLPVMSTIGIGISFGNSGMIVGATMLLAGNYLALLLATITVFYLRGLRPQVWYQFEAEKYIKKSLIFIILSIFLLSIPLTALTIYQFYAEKPASVIKTVIKENLNQEWDYRMEGIEIKGNLVIVYLYSKRPLAEELLLQIKRQIEERLAGEYSINFRIIPVDEVTV